MVVEKIVIEREIVQKIYEHCLKALRERPRKAFGLLFGQKQGDTWVVKSLVNDLRDASEEFRLENVFEEYGWPDCDCPREDFGFAIRPEDVKRACEEAEQYGWRLLAVYHLHPCSHRRDQSPAIPSKVDRVLALPSVLMIIVHATQQEGIKSLRAFRILDDAEKSAQEISIEIKEK